MVESKNTQSDQINENSGDISIQKSITFHKMWKFIPAAILLIGIIVFVVFNPFGKSDAYDYWVKTGVLTTEQNKNQMVNNQEFIEILKRLSGENNASIPVPEGELTVKDGVQILSDYFNLSEQDTLAMQNNLKADSKLTYKMAAQLIHNFAGELYDENNSESAFHNVSIHCAGATVTNKSIDGNLYIMQGVGNGEVTLDNVSISGRLYVLGGGMSSVIINDSDVKEVYVNKQDGQVRVYAKSNTTIEKVVLESGAKLQNDSNTQAFQQIEFSEKMPSESQLLLNGSFSKIEVSKSEIRVKLENGSIEELSANSSAADSTIEVAANANVHKLNANSAVIITGDGNVNEANINAVGVKMQIAAQTTNTSDEVKSKEPESIFTSDGTPRNGLKMGSTELNSLFVQRYAKTISDALKNGKAIEVEGFVFLPDKTLTEIIAKSTRMYYFENIAEIGNIGCAGRITDFKKVTALLNDDGVSSPIKGTLVQNVKDFSGIEYLENLQSLSLLNVNTSDLSPITKLINLKSLSVQYNEFAPDMASLGQMGSLNELIIVGYNSKETSLAYLSNFNKVKSLTMYGFPQLTDFSSLGKMKSLEDLNLRFISATNPGGVESLKELTSLKKIVMQEMTGWVPYIYYAPALEDITITFNFKADYVAIMKKIPNLRRATFGNNDFLGADNWADVLSLKNLVSLSISGGKWLNETEMRQVFDAFSNLPTEQKTEAKFREMENQQITNKKAQLTSGLPSCQFTYGDRDKMDLPANLK